MKILALGVIILALSGGVAQGGIENVYRSISLEKEKEKTIDVWTRYHQDAWFHLGLAYLHKDRLLEAFNAFYFSLGYNPYSLEAYQNIAYISFRMADFREAAIALSVAIELEPQNPQSHHLLGVIYTMYALYDNAVEELERAAAISPKNALILYDLGFALEFNGRFDSAKENYQKAIKIDPAFSEAQERLLLVTEKINRTENLRGEAILKHVK